jgi:hypothetical protein
MGICRLEKKMRMCIEGYVSLEKKTFMRRLKNESTSVSAMSRHKEHKD